MRLRSKILITTQDAFFHSKGLLMKRQMEGVGTILSIVSILAQTLLQFIPVGGQLISTGLAIATGITHGVTSLIAKDYKSGAFALLNVLAPFTRIHINPNVFTPQQLPRLIPQVMQWGVRYGFVKQTTLAQFNAKSKFYYKWLRRGRGVKGFVQNAAEGNVRSMGEKIAYPIIHEFFDRLKKKEQEMARLVKSIAQLEKEYQRELMRMDRVRSMAELENARQDALAKGYAMAERFDAMTTLSEEIERLSGNDIEELMKNVRKDQAKAAYAYRKEQQEQDEDKINAGRKDDLAGSFKVKSTFIASITAQPHKINKKNEPTHYVMTVSYVSRAKMLNYTYYNVAREELMEFLFAPSKGKYWNMKYRRLRERVMSGLPSIVGNGNKLVKEMTPAELKTNKSAYEKARRKAKRENSDYVPYDLHAMISKYIRTEGVKMKQEYFQIQYQNPILHQKKSRERPIAQKHARKVRRMAKGKQRMRKAGFLPKKI